MPKHLVQQGEGISSIADQHGFFPATIWDHPENAALKAEREDPDILAPGDQVFIPELRQKTVDCDTGQRHRFRRLGVPALLRLQVFVGPELRANQPYVLTVDGVAQNGTTDGDGVLEANVPPRSQKAVLEIGPDQHRFEIRLGHIDPVATLTGVQSRLNNLGFDCGAPNGVMGDATRAALRAFQELAGLPLKDDWQDPATHDALRRLHDSREWPKEEKGPLEEADEQVEDDDEDAPAGGGPATAGASP